MSGTKEMQGHSMRTCQGHGHATPAHMSTILVELCVRCVAMYRV